MENNVLMTAALVPDKPEQLYNPSAFGSVCVSDSVIKSANSTVA